MVTKKTSSLPSINSPKEEPKTPLVSNTVNVDNEDRIAALESKLNALIDILNSNSVVTANCPKNSDGNRQIQL